MLRILSKVMFASALCVASAATAAFADAPKPSADQLFDQAAAAFAAGRYAEAQQKLEQVWALKRVYDVAGNLGVAEVKLGMYVQAAEHLSWALRSFPLTEPAKARRGFEQELAKARAQCGALHIQVGVDGAEVMVNGRKVGVAPLPGEVFVEPGTVKVSAQRGGYSIAPKTVTVGKGEVREASLAAARLAPPWSPGSALIVPAGVLAAAGIAVGAGLTAAANAKGSDIATLQGELRQGGSLYPCAGAGAPDTCKTLHDSAASRDALSKGAAASFVVGGTLALVAGGLGIWRAWAPRDDKTQARSAHLAPFVGVGQAGVVWVGAW